MFKHQKHAHRGITLEDIIKRINEIEALGDRYMISSPIKIPKTLCYLDNYAVNPSTALGMFDQININAAYSYQPRNASKGKGRIKLDLLFP